MAEGGFVWAFAGAMICYSEGLSQVFRSYVNSKAGYHCRIDLHMKYFKSPVMNGFVFGTSKRSGTFDI